MSVNKLDCFSHSFKSESIPSSSILTLYLTLSLFHTMSFFKQKYQKMMLFTSTSYYNLLFKYLFLTILLFIVPLQSFASFSAASCPSTATSLTLRSGSSSTTSLTFTNMLADNGQSTSPTNAFCFSYWMYETDSGSTTTPDNSRSPFLISTYYNMYQCGFYVKSGTNYYTCDKYSNGISGWSYLNSWVHITMCALPSVSTKCSNTLGSYAEFPYAIYVNGINSYETYGCPTSKSSTVSSTKRTSLYFNYAKSFAGSIEELYIFLSSDSNAPLSDTQVSNYNQFGAFYDSTNGVQAPSYYWSVLLI
jgi:hypothetical protein